MGELVASGERSASRTEVSPDKEPPFLEIKETVTSMSVMDSETRRSDG